MAETAGQRLATSLGEGVCTVLAYGSCVRDSDPTEGLLDLYVIVSGYEAVYGHGWLSRTNRLLPPNVFYRALALEQATVRIKFAIISVDDFERGIARAALPYLWGRFAQPVRLVVNRDERARERVIESLAVAVERLLSATHPLMAGAFTADALWERGLRLSYATELRPEPGERAQALVARDADHYRRLTAAAAERVGLVAEAGGSRYRSPAGRRAYWSTRLAWTGRRWGGRAATLVRLVKASLTFQGGVDYAVWKVERHTGMSIPVTPRLRRHPLIFGWPLLWRLLRHRLLR